MKYFPFFLISLLACNTEPNPTLDITSSFHDQPIEISDEAAQNLIVMPLKCIAKEYPNKLGQTIGSAEDLKSPKDLHPAFYGCFDWHSAVHGHWSIVRLLKHYPNLAQRNEAMDFLHAHITHENIAIEVAYFQGKHNKSYERMYGWTWLLKLAEELYTWDHEEAQSLYSVLKPLTDIIVDGYLNYLPKLNYPIRVGTHTNTAFGLSFAYDYATTVGDSRLQTMIENRAKDFYLQDTDCPIGWEPSGHDFLSPCLEEANLMGRILNTEEYKRWMAQFLPNLSDPLYSLSPGIVSDRTDGHLVHLDGVNFSRAWCLNRIAQRLPNYNHLNDIANQHIYHSLGDVIGDDYEGGHWLGSFAIYAFGERAK